MPHSSSTDYSPPPPYDAPMLSDRSSSPGSQTSTRISLDIGEEAVLRGESLLETFDVARHCPGDDAIVRAKVLQQNVAPTLTVSALEDAFIKWTCDDWLGLTIITRICGWTRLLPCVILDILKAPFFLIGAAEEGARGGLGNAFANMKNPREKAAMELILKSFEQRFFQTLYFLDRFVLETPLSLHQEFSSGNITPFMTLTLVFTAFASRRAPVGHIYLASGKILSKKHCPKQGQALFTLISQIKDHLIVSGMTRDLPQDEAIEKMRRWTPIIKTGLQDSDEIHALLAQQEMDEVTKQNFWEFLRTLNQIQKEITKIQISEDQAQVLKNTPVQLAQT